MARSQQQIKANILAQIAADPVLGPLLTSTSLTSIFGLLASIYAYIQNLFEQSWDDYKSQITTYSQNTPAASANWIAAQAFLYQYDSSGNPNTNTLTIQPNGALGYTTVNPLFNIITRCSVTTAPDNIILVKIAQGSTPAPITGTALAQAQSYFEAKEPAGITPSVISLDSDKIAIYGTVYYKPGFAGVAPQNVTNALNTYLNNIAIYSIGSKEPINYLGEIKVSEIIDAIMGADGISDFKPTKILCRADLTAFGSASVVYDLSTSINNRSYVLASGYAVGETTAGQDWATTILFAAE